MTNIQALGKLLRKYGTIKPKMQDRMITLAKNSPLTACTQVMAVLHIHAARNPVKFIEEMLPAYDALAENMLTDEKLTTKQIDELMVAIVTK